MLYYLDFLNIDDYIDDDEDQILMELTSEILSSHMNRVTRLLHHKCKKNVDYMLTEIKKYKGNNFFTEETEELFRNYHTNHFIPQMLSASSLPY